MPVVGPVGVVYLTVVGHVVAGLTGDLLGVVPPLLVPVLLPPTPLAAEDENRLFPRLVMSRAGGETEGHSVREVRGATHALPGLGLRLQRDFAAGVVVEAKR